MVCAVKSDRIVRAAKYIASIFSNAVYHIVAVIPRYNARYFLTSLYSRTLKRIAEEAIYDLEIALAEHRVLSMRSAILEGKPANELLDYAKKHNVDLVVLTAAASPSPIVRVVGSVTRSFIRYSKSVVFVHPMTITSIHIPPKISRILFVSRARVPSEVYDRALKLTIHIAKSFNSEIVVAHVIKHEEEEKLLNTIKSHLSQENIRFSIDVLRPKSRDEEVELILELAKYVDVSIQIRAHGIIARVSKILPFWTRSLMPCEIVAGLSTVPIFFV